MDRLITVALVVSGRTGVGQAAWTRGTAPGRSVGRQCWGRGAPVRRTGAPRADEEARVHTLARLHQQGLGDRFAEARGGRLQRVAAGGELQVAERGDAVAVGPCLPRG